MFTLRHSAPRRTSAAALLSLSSLGIVALGTAAPRAALAQTAAARANVMPVLDSAPANDVFQVVQRARAAEKAGDAKGYRRQVERLAQLAPRHPTARLYTARALALTGDVIGAVAALESVVPLGAAVDLAGDTAFRSLRGNPAFERLLAPLAANAAPLVRSDTAFGLGDPDLIPESVAYDPEYQTFYAGSLGKNKIVRIAPSKVVTDFATVGPAGAGRVIGIKVDAPRRRLWAATQTFDSSAAPSRDGQRVRVALDVYDLRTGQRLRRYEPTDQQRVAHFFNDVAIAVDGTVYVTDMENDAVLRVPAGRDGAPGDSLQRLAPPATGHFSYPNGIDLSPDGRRLYVAHTEGVSVWDLGGDKPGHALDFPMSASTAGIDGLYACMRSLVVVQRGLGFDQVTRLRLDAGGQRITGADVLERRHPAYENPTTGVVVRDALFYLPNPQISRLKDDGTLTPADNPHPSVVFKLPIGERCR